MELKEMENTAIIVDTEGQLEEVVAIFEEHAWGVNREMSGATYIPLLSKGVSVYVVANSRGLSMGIADENKFDRDLITLAQFKERNGIMKYEQDDVLVSGNGTERLILGVCGRAYIATCADDFKRAYGVFTEYELQDYTLKTDEPEKVEVSFKEAAAIVAKDKGVSVEELLIKD